MNRNIEQASIYRITGSELGIVYLYCPSFIHHSLAAQPFSLHHLQHCSCFNFEFAYDYIYC